MGFMQTLIHKLLHHYRFLITQLFWQKYNDIPAVPEVLQLAATVHPYSFR